MPNSLSATGLVTATQAELVTQLTLAFQNIYGADVNLDADTPDGQLMMIFIQAYLDVLDLITEVYSSMDPDNAIGVTLDQRVALNGIQRQAGTYTITPISIVMGQANNLYGLDQSAQQIYTVADNAGNQWQLVTTQHFGAPGTYVCNFQAATPGANLTIPNTITVPVTIVIGVLSINNPTTYTTLGLNEETDVALKNRRRRSVALASQGYLAGLLAALQNITGVTSAFVYENNTASTNTDGVPSHSIWAIVAGSPAAADVANAIYNKRNAGAGMYGATSYNITQVDGSIFTVNWDYVAPQNLFIKFNVSPLDGVTPVNIAAIKTALSSTFNPGVYSQVNINEIAEFVQGIDPNALVTFPSGTAGFSTTATGPWTYTLRPTAKNLQFVVPNSDVIILPMRLTPVTSVVTHGTNQTFNALGGYGALTFTISTNNSGGTINSSTGVYTAGTTTGVSDTITVTDAQSNTATATVAVV